jgi:hypothetical protein
VLKDELVTGNRNGAGAFKFHLSGVIQSVK